jgi:hypothetical protein
LTPALRVIRLDLVADGGDDKKGVLKMAYFELHDGTQVAHTDLPDASLQGLLNRAASHVYGNEVASQVTSFIRSALELKAGDTSAEAKTAIKSYREAHPDEISAKTQEFAAAKTQAIQEGNLGVRVAGSGTSVDPLMKEMVRLAKAEIQIVFQKKKWTFPTKDATFTTNKGQPSEFTADANGWTRRWLDVSNDKLIGGKGDPNRPRIEKLAQRNLQAKAALVKRAEDAVADAGEDSGL